MNPGLLADFTKTFPAGRRRGPASAATTIRSLLNLPADDTEDAKGAMPGGGWGPRQISKNSTQENAPPTALAKTTDSPSLPG